MTPLTDSFGSVHDSLRISVTDRCNIRCFYCMPETDVHFVDRREILDFEEIERFVRIAAGLGVRKLRVTGGEPLLRRDLPSQNCSGHPFEKVSMATHHRRMVNQEKSLRNNPCLAAGSSSTCEATRTR